MSGLVLHSCMTGNLDMLIHSVNRGYDVHFELEYPLQTACRYGHLNIVKYLTEEQNADIHAHGEFAFRWACSYGYLDVVKYLVEYADTHGHSIDIDYHNGYALEWSCYNGQLDVVNYLLSLGAKVEFSNYKCLVVAAGNGYFEVVKRLCLQICKLPHSISLRKAITYGNVSICMYIHSHYGTYLEYTRNDYEFVIFYLLLHQFYYEPTWCIKKKNVKDTDIWDGNIGLIVCSFSFNFSLLFIQTVKKNNSAHFVLDDDLFTTLFLFVGKNSTFASLCP